MTRTDWLIAAILTLAMAPLVMTGLTDIPFHPDETSLLYQSRDVELLFSNPQPVMDPAREPEARTASYRYLNAPLPKLVLALGRLAAGFDKDSVSVDWSWTASWQQNERAGAVPPAGALLGGRVASAVLLLLTVPSLYLAGWHVGGRRVAVAAALLIGTSGLALLHGRRAMAEGTMLLSTSVALLVAFSFGRSHPWLAGAAAGLALAAKHSLAPMVGGLMVWLILTPGQAAGRRWLHAGLAGTLAFAVLWFLTPALWLNPIDGALQIVQARRALVARQVAETIALAPGAVLATPVQRLASLLGHGFVLPLQFQEVGNYRAELAPAIDAYAQRFWLHGWRGAVGGGVLLAAALFGGITAVMRTPDTDREQLHNRLGLLIITLAMLAATLLAIPLPIQRYYLPLLPLVILWAAIGMDHMLSAVALVLVRVSGPNGGADRLVAG